MLKNIFLVNRWRKKLSICGNCYFILTLLGVCHETVNFVLPLRPGVYIIQMDSPKFLSTNSQRVYKAGPGLIWFFAG